MKLYEFFKTFVKNGVNVEVHMSPFPIVYIGCETNWDAFLAHMKLFGNMTVASAIPRDGKLIVFAVA